jgi:hypothetical protein
VVESSPDPLPAVDDGSERASSAQVQRLERNQRLAQTRDGARGRALSEVVQDNLEHVWATGGRAGATEAGRQPNSILIREGFLLRPVLHGETSGEGVLQRLIKSRGLQLKLQLLLLFEAQCRAGPGFRARPVRSIKPTADEDFVSWTQLILSPAEPTPRTGRGRADLRARQITEALRVLQREHLVKIPSDSAGRRRYEDAVMLAETGRPDEPSFVVPGGGAFAVSRHFFTNLWIFALTDSEIATFLMLSFLRSRFLGRHGSTGVFAVQHTRQDEFGITPATYRSHTMLHRFRLIDRMLDEDRDYTTGRVRNPEHQLSGQAGAAYPPRTSAGRFAEIGGGEEHTDQLVHVSAGTTARGRQGRALQPHRFKINDEVLRRPALETIAQILGHPTYSDIFRRMGVQFSGPAGAAPHLDLP